jgi:hypothetical protein
VVQVAHPTGAGKQASDYEDAGIVVPLLRKFRTTSMDRIAGQITDCLADFPYPGLPHGG